MSLRPSLAGAVVALLAAPAAASAAPTIALDKPCYVSASQSLTEPVNIVATGFSSYAVVDVYLNDVQQMQDPRPMTDINGDLKGAISAPFVASGQQFFMLRLAEQKNPANAAVASAKVTALSVTSSPVAPRTTSSRVRFRGRGFTNRLLPIYAHYVFKDKVRKTVRIGKPFGDCGQFSVRRRQFPIKHPHTGIWMVQFDQQPTYNPTAPIYTRLKIVVTRKPGHRS